MDESEEPFEVSEENFLELTPAEIATAVASVKYGTTWAKDGFDDTQAKNLIRYFHLMFKAGRLFENVQLQPVEHAFLDYVEHAFSRIVTGNATDAGQECVNSKGKSKGKSVDVAFGLSPGRGEYPREDNVLRDICLAACAILLMRKGGKWECAMNDAAKHFAGVDSNSVAEVAHEKYGIVLERMTNDALEEILKMETPEA